MSGDGVVVRCEDVDVVVVSSKQPNQPGVLHVAVEVELVVVVVLSRQPHQPGVLQVSVRVRV